MTTQDTLTIALIVALSSNAVLLLILLLKSQNVNLFNDSKSATLEQSARDSIPRSGSQVNNFIYPRIISDDADLQNIIPDTPQDAVVTSASNTDSKDLNLVLRLLQNELQQSSNVWKSRELGYLGVSRTFHTETDVRNQYPLISDVLKRYHKDLNFHRRPTREEKGRIFRDEQKSAKSHISTTWDTATSQNSTHFKQPQITKGNEHAFGNSRLNLTEPPEYQSFKPIQQQTHRSVERNKRGAKAPSKETVSDKRSDHSIHGIFSTFTDGELAKFDPAVYDILIPALVHFETMIIREFDSFHSVIISHDLRLETLEKFMLNIISGNDLEPQSDIMDNKSDPDSPTHILVKKEGFLPAENNSEILEVHLDVDGSGESEWSFTQAATLPPQPTAIQNVALYDFYRILSTVEQKVMALENYNVMSDSELTRVRSEVVKMDDKVTELDRRQRNLQIRTSMHTQKITELEVYMSKSELGIHTALDSYSRINARLESFKDKLAEFRSDLQAVATQFGRQDQISNELRAADSYKAHDIQEMRKSVFGIEGRLNGLYRVLDQNLDTVRSDLRVMLDRLCANNKLAC